MELYNKADLELIEKNVSDLEKKIEDVKRDLFSIKDTMDINEIVEAEKQEKKEEPKERPQPSPEDVKNIVEIVLNFVREKKLKIYGGTSHNATIKHKNPNDAFYTSDDIPDIDCYSNDPINDLVELCDILYNKGYTDAIGREAIHSETYKIFTRGYNAIDLSYVPKNIYSRIPFVEIDNVRYIHPHFAMIDLFKMITEPYFSSFRWKKTFPRIYLLQKHYPVNKIHKEVSAAYKHKIDVQQVLKTVFDYIKNNLSIYVFGEFAYNELLKESLIKKSHIKKIKIPFYRFVSINYAEDVKKLLRQLETYGNDITTTEYYPFWHFTDYSCEIKYKGEIIAHIYNHLDRCTPVKTITYSEHTYDPNCLIQIGCFDFVLLMEMINAFKMKVNEDQEKRLYHNTMISHLIEMRNNYFKITKKNMLDESLFQSLSTSCIGKTHDPLLEAKKKRKMKKEQGKNAIFMYKPIKKLSTKWIFKNTSGNEINNPKNLKIKQK